MENDMSEKAVYYELLRDLLQDKPQTLQEYAEYMPAEVVYKALIIREFMTANQISDIRQGVRQFTAYEREKLQRLSLV
jgi:hypothetical protein